MDRHNYVKSLIEQRDNLKKDIESLSPKIEKARKRTKEHVLGFAAESLVCNNQGYCVGSLNFHSSVSYAYLPEHEQVSDEAIKKLHQEIFNLETQKSQLEKELIDLQSRDFVKYLKNLINES